jgi:DNA polymerase bacteriophage-type
MSKLFLDYETFSLLDLREVGLDNYARHPSTGISCLGWTLDDEDVEAWLPHLGPLPTKLLEAFLNPKIIKIAWHAAFDCGITNHILGPRYVPGLYIPISEYRDPIVLAHALSLPGKLETVAQILKLQHQKDPRGDDLKDMFCKPVSVGGELTLFGVSPPLFRDHNSHPRQFADYVEYCKKDILAMREAWLRMAQIPFPEHEWQGWLLDQKINAFGMPGRRDLAEKGLRLAERFINTQRQLLKDKTGLANPNSDPQMKGWVHERGYPWESLRAPTVQAELKNPESKITSECRDALMLRSSARKSSYTKLEKFLSLLSTDDRLRNQFRYLGAARTGRWASGGGEDASMQVQNLARGEKAVKKKLTRALELLDQEDYDGIVREFTNTPNLKDSVTVVEFIITLLRSLFQAKPGHKIIVADKNAIENRMLGWAAGCPAILEVFKHSKEDGGDPYLAFGTHLYNKTYAEMWATYASGNEEERQMSKPPVLGGGYGLGGGEMYMNEYGDEVRGGLWGYALTVCGVDMPKELAHKAVDILRKAWPEVPVFWLDLEEAFKQVLMRGGVVKVGEVTWNKQTSEWIEHPTKGKQCVITFRRIDMGDGNYSIRMELPSGRALHYLNATIENEAKTSKKGNPYTAHTIFYDGIEHTASQDATGKTVKRHHKWGRVKTNGGKLCGNSIQSMARDDLLHSMFLADDMGFSIWGLFHDELACEELDDIFGLRLEDLIWCMVQVAPWAKGLLLGAEGYEAKVYHK